MIPVLRHQKELVGSVVLDHVLDHLGVHAIAPIPIPTARASRLQHSIAFQHDNRVFLEEDEARMMFRIFIVQCVAVLMIFSALARAEEGVFVPSETQRVLLQEGIEKAKKLEKRYSALTMEGTTEHQSSRSTAEEQHCVDRFRFLRRGREYCLLEINKSNPEARHGKTAVYHTGRLITPKANYQFVALGKNDAALFSLGEKINIENSAHLVDSIGYLVNVNWETGSAPFGFAVDLSCPFDIVNAKTSSPNQGGYIKGMTEELIDGEKVIVLKMGYYYHGNNAKGEISFFPDHYWAVRNSMTESVNSKTGKIINVYKTRNEYIFDGDFPKLKKATIETWDADAKTLLQSEVSTISNIDFTEPDLSLFDPKQFPIDSDVPTLTPARMSPARIICIVLGIVLIAWGLWLRFSKRGGTQ